MPCNFLQRKTYRSKKLTVHVNQLNGSWNTEDCIKTYIFSKVGRYVESAGKKYQEIKDPDSSEKPIKN